MSTSPSRSVVAAGPPPEAPALPVTEPFPYDLISANTADGNPRALSRLRPQSTDTMESDAAGREARARLQGRQEGHTEAQKVFDDQLTRERGAVADALAQFTVDRAAYFQKIEGEVVRLALAVARKILHREAQLDPLLLAGIVRVALENIDGATQVVLRVHPQNAGDWRRYLATRMDPARIPEIVEDPSQPLDRCALETSMGTAALGLEVQLKEIEQGLMDLLAARPGASR